MHQCPVCQSPVDTKPAYRRYSRRLGYFPAGQGIRCTACNTVLKVDAGRSTFLNIVTMIFWLAAIVSIDVALPGAPILLSFIVATASVVWVSSQAHRLITLSAPRIGDDLLPDDECWPDRPGEEYGPTEEELREEELREIEIIIGIPSASVDRDWTCKSCGEENTKDFALCWKCGNAFSSSDS